jgi:2-oxoisovalerate dehydrogenase E1 component
MLITDPTSVAAPAKNLPKLEVLHEKALLIRAVEERLLHLFSQGKLSGTVHTCIGQEWTGIAVAEALIPGDLIFSNHRCHGHYLASRDDIEGLIAEVMGKRTGMCGGRGGSQHICSGGFFSNGIQGGIVPVAAGLAFAQKLKKSGNIAVVFIGDGTLGEGVVYETLNLACKWGLPLLIVLENNLYAQSTPQGQTLSGEICARAEAFGARTRRSSTEEPVALLADVDDCIALVRNESAPHFIQIDTFRLMAHSKGDDDRDPAEVESYRRRDPCVRFVQRHPETSRHMLERIQKRIDAAVAHAETAPFADVGPAEQRRNDTLHWVATRIAKPDRTVNLIHESFRRALNRDERVVFVGEDIEGPYGGAFKVTKNLSLEFPGRVRNTPISEAAVTGLSNGLALAGFLPVCELMFGDFATLAFDQFVNHASKFRFMYNGQVSTPIIVRTPMGGRRGYGPTHSQSLEKHFLGIPDTRVLALHARFDPGELYDRLFATIDLPTLVVENKLLYGQRINDEPPDGFYLEHSNELFPTTRLRPAQAPQLTILCYGGMLHEVEAAICVLFDEHEVAAEVICPTELYPWNPRPLLESVQKTRRLVIVEEGQAFAGFGAEVAAKLTETDPGIVTALRRVAPPPSAIPSSGHLEKQFLPDASDVVRAVLEVVANAR